MSVKTTRTIAEIEKRRDDLNTEIGYLSNFLSKCFKGSAAKVHAEFELKALIGVRDALNWVLNEDEPLPF